MCPLQIIKKIHVFLVNVFIFFTCAIFIIGNIAAILFYSMEILYSLDHGSFFRRYFSNFRYVDDDNFFLVRPW